MGAPAGASPGAVRTWTLYKQVIKPQSLAGCRGADWTRSTMCGEGLLHHQCGAAALLGIPGGHPGASRVWAPQQAPVLAAHIRDCAPGGAHHPAPEPYRCAQTPSSGTSTPVSRPHVHVLTQVLLRADQKLLQQGPQEMLNVIFSFIHYTLSNPQIRGVAANSKFSAGAYCYTAKASCSCRIPVPLAKVGHAQHVKPFYSKN